MRRAMRGGRSNGKMYLLMPRPGDFTPEQEQQMANYPLPDQHLSFLQYFAQKPSAAAAHALQNINLICSSSYSKDIYGVEMTFTEQLAKLAAADPSVSGLCGLLLHNNSPSRQLRQLLRQNLAEMAEALSKGISMVAISHECIPDLLPWSGGPPGATAIDTVGALTCLLGHTIAASMPTSAGDAIPKPHLLSAQKLARTDLFVELARACSSMAAQLPQEPAKNRPAGFFRQSLEFAGVLLRLFLQLVTHWPGRVLAGNTISQCAGPAADLAAAVLRAVGFLSFTVTTTGFTGSATRGNVAGAWPAPRQYAFSVAHVLVKELSAEARRATHHGCFDQNSIKLSLVTKGLLCSTSMWYLLLAGLGLGVMELRQQQQQSQNPRQPQLQTLLPHHLQLLRSLGIDKAALGPQESGEFSFEDKIRQSRVLSCCRGHEPPLAVEAAGQYMALAFCKPVPRLLPMLTSKKQDSSSLMRHWPAASTSSSEHLHVGKQQQAPTAPPGRTGLPRAWLYATLVSRVLPNEVMPFGDLVEFCDAGGFLQPADLSIQPCDRDLLPALEFSVRAAADYCEWSRATGMQWQMYGPSCNSSCITTILTFRTLVVAAAITAPPPTAAGDSPGSTSNASEDATRHCDDAVDWRPLHSFLITCLKAVSEHHSGPLAVGTSVAAHNRIFAVTLQIIARSKAQGISNSRNSTGNNPASCYTIKEVDTSLLTARALIAAGKLLVQLYNCESEYSSTADGHPDACDPSNGDVELVAKEMLPSVANACCWVAQQLQQMAACSSRPPGTLADVLLKLANDGQQLAASITAAATELGSLGSCDGLQDNSSSSSDTTSATVELGSLGGSRSVHDSSTSSSSNDDTSAVDTCARHGSMTPSVQMELRNSIGPNLESFGSAVCAQLPVKYCCNNPGCVTTSHMSEQALVGGKGCVCTGCKVARYCGRDCQHQHWKEHKAVCKRIEAVRRAASSD